MIDLLDKKILDVLSRDGRASFTQISRLLKIPESTVRSRVSTLEESKVIKKYSAVIDPAKLGYGSVAIVGIDVKGEKFLEIARQLKLFDNVKFIATSSGDHTIMAEIWSQNSEELTGFIKKNIESMDGVIRTCPAVINERLKE